MRWIQVCLNEWIDEWVDKLYSFIYFLSDAAAGGSDDWAKGVAGIPFSYTIELWPAGSPYFVLPADQIEPQAEEMWAGLRATFNEIKRILQEWSY